MKVALVVKKGTRRRKPGGKEKVVRLSGYAILARLLLSLFIASALGLVALQGILATRWGQWYIVEALGRAFDRSLHVERISFNLFRGFELKGVTIGERSDFGAGTAATIERLVLAYRPWEILRARIQIDEAMVEGPSIIVREGERGVWNWSDLFESDGREGSAEDDEAFAFPIDIQVKAFQIQRASVVVESASWGQIRVTGLDIVVSNIALYEQTADVVVTTADHEVTVDYAGYHYRFQPRLYFEATVAGMYVPAIAMSIGPTELRFDHAGGGGVLPVVFLLSASADIEEGQVRIEEVVTRLGHATELRGAATFSLGNEVSSGSLNLSRCRIDLADLDGINPLISGIHGSGLMTLDSTFLEFEGDRLASLIPFQLNAQRLILPENEVSLDDLTLSGTLFIDTAHFFQLELNLTSRRTVVGELAYEGLSLTGKLMTDIDFSLQHGVVRGKLQNFQGIMTELAIEYDSKTNPTAPLTVNATLKSENLAALGDLHLRGDASLGVTAAGKSLTDMAVSARLTSPDFYYLLDGSTSRRGPLSLMTQFRGNLMTGDVVVASFGGSFGDSLTLSALGDLADWGMREAILRDVVIEADLADLSRALPQEIYSAGERTIGGRIKLSGGMSGSFSEPGINVRAEVREGLYAEPDLSIDHLAGSIDVVGTAPVSISGNLSARDIRFAGEGSLGSLDIRFHLGDAAGRWREFSGDVGIRGGALRLSDKEPLDFRLSMAPRIMTKEQSISVDGAELTIRDVGQLFLSLSASAGAGSGSPNVSLTSSPLDLARLCRSLPLERYLSEKVDISGSAILKGTSRDDRVSADIELQGVNGCVESGETALTSLDGRIIIEGPHEALRITSKLRAESLLLSDIRQTPWRNVTFDGRGTLEVDERFELESSRIGIEGDSVIVESRGTLTVLNDGYRPVLHASLTVQPEGQLTIVEGVTLEGVLGLELDIGGSDRGMVFSGEVTMDDVAVSSLPAFSLSGMRGVVPFNHGQSLSTHRDSRELKEQLDRLSALMTASDRSVSSVRIDRIVFGNYLIGGLDLDLAWNNGMLRVEDLRCSLLDGKVSGNAVFDMQDPRVRYSIAANVTNVDFGLFSRKRFLGSRPSAPLNSYLAVNGVGTDVQGEYVITRVSLGTIDNLLLSFDPEELSPDIVAIRQYLSIARKMLIVHPHSMVFRIQNDNVSITILLMPLGIQFKTKVPLSIVWQSLGIEE